MGWGRGGGGAQQALMVAQGPAEAQQDGMGGLSDPRCSLGPGEPTSTAGWGSQGSWRKRGVVEEGGPCRAWRSLGG